MKILQNCNTAKAEAKYSLDCHYVSSKALKYFNYIIYSLVLITIEEKYFSCNSSSLLLCRVM